MQLRRIVSAILIPALAFGPGSMPALGAFARVVTPASGSVISGAVEVSVGYETDEKTPVTRAVLAVDGEVCATKSLQYPQSKGVLSLLWDSSSYPAGSRGLSVYLYSGRTLVAKSFARVQVGGQAAATPGKQDSKSALRVQMPNLRDGERVQGKRTVKIVPDSSLGTAPFVTASVDGSLRYLSNRRPFEFTLDTAAMSDGAHAVEIEVRDAQQNLLASRRIRVSVENSGSLTSEVAALAAQPQTPAPALATRVVEPSQPVRMTAVPAAPAAKAARASVEVSARAIEASPVARPVRSEMKVSTFRLPVISSEPAPVKVVTPQATAPKAVAAAPSARSASVAAAPVAKPAAAPVHSAQASRPSPASSANVESRGAGAVMARLFSDEIRALGTRPSAPEAVQESPRSAMTAVPSARPSGVRLSVDVRESTVRPAQVKPLAVKPTAHHTAVRQPAASPVSSLDPGVLVLAELPRSVHAADAVPAHPSLPKESAPAKAAPAVMPESEPAVSAPSSPAAAGPAPSWKSPDARVAEGVSPEAPAVAAGKAQQTSAMSSPAAARSERPEMTRMAMAPRPADIRPTPQPMVTASEITRLQLKFYDEPRAGIRDGNALVHLRSALQELGGTVVWDHNAKRATAWLGGQRVTFDMRTGVVEEGSRRLSGLQASIRNGRILVAANKLAAVFGLNVSWDSGRRAVRISRAR